MTGSLASTPQAVLGMCKLNPRPGPGPSLKGLDCGLSSEGHPPKATKAAVAERVRVSEMQDGKTKERG